jgi:DNA polymerase III subunit epsilon
MVIVGLDTETTGFDYDKGHRIIEACFSIYNQDEHGKINHIGTVTQRIDPKRSIPEEAQAVHGISLEDIEGMPEWKEFAPKVAKILSKADLLIIHNAKFDMAFLRGEQRDAGFPIENEPPTFCTMENSRWATPNGKNPSLKELCWSLGIDYDESSAHAASYDVSVMMECYAKGLEFELYINHLTK